MNKILKEIPLEQCIGILQKMQNLNLNKVYLSSSKGLYSMYILPCDKVNIFITKSELQKRIINNN
jgi:hypothetical protein